MEKNKTYSFRLQEPDIAKINAIIDKHELNTDSTTELVKSIIGKLHELSVNENAVEKIVSPKAENTIEMICSDTEFSTLNEIVEMCEIQGFAKNHKELYFKLLHVCQQRGEFIIDEQDRIVLQEKRNKIDE